MKEDTLLYRKLSYKLIGIMYRVYNEMGYGYQEKIYERAIIKELDSDNIKYNNQKYFLITYKGRTVGKYFLDFVIENKIVLELKRGNNFSAKNIEQIKGYLKASGLKLAILAHFTSNGVKIFRALNPNNLNN